MARNVIHFNELFTAITRKFQGQLKDFTIATRVELVQFPRDYLILGTNISCFSQTPSFGKFIELEKLDLVDRSILSEIGSSARLSVLEIGRRIRKPASTISSRIKKLQQRNIIQGYSAHIHCQEFGYQSYQLFIVTHNMTEEIKKKLFSYCHLHPHIIFYIQTVGRWNFEIIYEVEDQKQLQEFMIEIRSLFSDIIYDIESIVLFNHYVKYNQYPLSLDTKN